MSGEGCMVGGRLSNLFSGVVSKRLSAVEVDPERSHQHEFNGNTALRRLLGEENGRRRFPTRFIYFGEEEEDTLSTEGYLTWYDARENHPVRTEWRLYFPDNDVMKRAEEGDILLLAMRPDDTLLAIISPAHSLMTAGLLQLFGIHAAAGESFQFEDISASRKELDFASGFILRELGLQPPETGNEKLAGLIAKIAGDGEFSFPPTREISALARAEAEAPDPRDDPDTALACWLEFEEALFRGLERQQLERRIASGFMKDGEADVDAFVETALSVLNRRKSRMGLSLENHMEALLLAWQIRYERGAVTEGRSRPDFLFPGSREYHDPDFDHSLLTLLGVKSTLKDRWRQVLAEAARIEEKHLLTLQQGVSFHQIEEMRRNGLRFVVPSGLHGCFQNYDNWLMSVREFLELVRERQHRLRAL